MRYNIITISRQCGSGGHTIGQKIADALNIPLFDKNLLEEVAKRSGFTEEVIQDKGEHAPAAIWMSLSQGVYNGYMLNLPQTMPLEDQINAYQTEFIREAADKGPCVIIGRGADYILRDRKDCLNVYLYGDAEARALAVAQRDGISVKDAAIFIKKWDKRRAAHYNYVTDRVWGDVCNYTLCLDTTALGIDKCADIILQCIK
ncbi:MAG: cytidylate kinase-like family protein [Spirochaetales bacterium]|nr:cytidylate kinase-like family protein [Spirochaetales bacterium]